mgnify:FL=1|tara:strand:+ start:250 stop:684 length:435 start_codon:yes stop_codon:yes gene_type:complete
MAKLNADTKARLIEGIKLGMTNKLAAQYAGIAISTFYLWREKANAGEPLYMDLMDSLKRAEAQSAAHSLAVIKKAAQDGTWTAAAWMLERRHNFRRDPVVEVEAVDTSELVDPNTAEGRAAIIAHVAELPDDIILAALNRGATE